jgi:valyl-tRNA synthetase
VHVHSRPKKLSCFEGQLPTIVALTKGCKSAKVVRDLSDIPAGCGGTVVIILLLPFIPLYG